MPLSLALSLSPIISEAVRGLAALITTTLEHDAACQTLEAQCASLQAQVDAAQAHIREEKAAQRRFRAEIVAFVKERSESRSANTSRVSGAGDVSVASNASANSTPADAWLSDLRRHSQDSPLMLRSKRRGSSVITPERLEIIVKRRRLATGVSPRRPTLLERLA